MLKPFHHSQFLALLFLLVGCQELNPQGGGYNSLRSQASASGELEAWLDQSEQSLVSFDSSVGASIKPEINQETGRGDYTLVYYLAPNGKSITTKFRGPSSATGVGLKLREIGDGRSRTLMAAIANSGHEVALARWQVSDSLEVEDAFVRLDPILEWRVRDNADPTVFDLEWRLIDEGGDWMESPPQK